MAAIDPPRRLDGLRGPMPWQQDVLDVACEIDPATGLFYYREVVVVVPRQAGKTSLSRAKVTHRCITTPRGSVLYTAQDRNMARRRLEKSFLEPLTYSPLAAALKPAGARGRLGWDGTNGREKVVFANGAEIYIIAAQSETSGHGDTLPEAHLDEYFAQVDGRLEQAIGPAMIAATGPQRWVTSAAGNAKSLPLWGKVEAGRARIEAGVESRIAYFEYSAPPDADRRDPVQVAGVHPAVGHTIDIADVMAEQTSMDSGPGGESEWDRAYFGWWPRASAKPWIIPQASWEACGLSEEAIDWTGEPVWVVDVSPERDAAAIGLAGDTPGRRCYLECVAHEPGTDWVVNHLKRLREQFGGNLVGIDGTGPAGALEHDLLEAGFEVRRLSLRNKVDACGELYDDVLAGNVAHGNDPLLASNLAGAAKKASGEAWLYVRGSSLEDITPLYAVTLARWLWVDTNDGRYAVEDSIY